MLVSLCFKMTLSFICTSLAQIKYFKFLTKDLIKEMNLSYLTPNKNMNLSYLTPNKNQSTGTFVSFEIKIKKISF